MSKRSLTIAGKSAEYLQEDVLPTSKKATTSATLYTTATDSFLARLARAGIEKYLSHLNINTAYTATKGSHLTVTCKLCHWHPPVGAISRTRLVIHEDGSFYFQVLLDMKQCGVMETCEEFLLICEMMANVKGDYKFCPGLDTVVYETNFLSKIRYDLKNVRRADHPFKRIDSSNCLLMHKLAKNASIMEKGRDDVPCSACKRLLSDLTQRVKTVLVTSPSVKVKRQQPSSNSSLCHQLVREKESRIERCYKSTVTQKSHSMMNSMMNCLSWWMLLKRKEVANWKKLCWMLISIVLVSLFVKFGK